VWVRSATRQSAVAIFLMRGGGNRGGNCVSLSPRRKLLMSSFCLQIHWTGEWPAVDALWLRLGKGFWLVLIPSISVLYVKM